MASFIQTIRPTPFALYDADSEFQVEADNMVTFVLTKLGENVLSVELTKRDIWACFEEACAEFGALMLEYQAKSNLASILGTPTGSVNLTNVYIQPNLEFLNKQAEPYAGLIGWGSEQDSVSGSIDLTIGKQDYDLYTDLKIDDGTAVFDLQPSGSQSKMKIFEVYHYAPIQYVFNSNFASNMVAAGLPVESYIPDTRFYVLPLFEDVLRAGMLEAAQRVRRSNYSYRISGRKIRIFPTPTANTPFTMKLWIRVGFVSQIAPGLTSSGSFITSGTIQDQTLYGVSTPANIPYEVVPFNTINQWGKQWIRQYCLALCKELLGLIRSKFKNYPIPGAEVQLNGDDLISQAREDKDKMLTTLRERLDALTYDKLSEQEALKAENIQKQLQTVPMPPNWIIKMG